MPYEPNKAELIARYERAVVAYNVQDDFTDRHPYPSGMKRLAELHEELDWLRAQLGNDSRPTAAQSRCLHALFHARGIVDRRIRLAIISGIAGRVVSTSAALTVGEASKVIERLRE